MQETLRGSPYTPQQFRHHVTLRKADTCGSHATARTLEIALAASRRGKTYTRRYGPVRALPHRVRYLVTGGAGFIGSHLVERLVQSGAEVTVLDDLSTGRRENLRNVRDRIRFIRGNAGRLEVCRRAMQGVDYVLHHAALTSVPHSTRKPHLANQSNVTATLNVLIAAREAEVRRVVFAGSTAAYGDAAEVPNHEGLLPRPQSVYAAAKLAGEAYCQAFWHTHGLETVVLRYFNIFGPRQNLESQYGAVIPLFIAAALRGESPVMFGDGTQTRDFTFVSNVVDANLLACHAPAEQAAGGVFNIGCGMATSVRELWDMIADLVGVEIEPTEEPARAGDVRHSMASIERARELLGYNPTIDMATGLARTIDYFRGRVRAHDRLRIAV
jgi:nucleoside-diphosphate-sugar epimerase